MSLPNSHLPPATRTTVAWLGAWILTLSSAAFAQTSPAHGPIANPAEMPLSDYLGLLQQIAPAAAAGTRDYLAAYRLQCGRTLSTAELRQAIAKEGGDPVLMGLIRAEQAQDTAARAQLVRHIHCTPGASQ